MLESNPRVAQVLTAVDAAEALRIMRGDETSQPFVDAVFADLSMPGLNGMELARVLTAVRNPPALVFITGHDEDALEAFEVGALDYIMKPPKPHRGCRARRKSELNTPAPARPLSAEAAAPS